VASDTRSEVEASLGLPVTAHLPFANGRALHGRSNVAVPIVGSATLRTIGITARGRPVAIAAARQKRKRHTILVGTQTILIQPGETGQ
jgi:hypothetical protein